MLRPKLNRIWAKDSDALRRDPGDAKYLQGWISEIPTFQVLNFLQYKVDTTILAIAERGIPEWGSDIQYGIGRVVWDDVDDSIYIAIVQKPDKLKRPSANLAHWSKSSIQITKKEFDNIAKAITNHIADKNNPHKVSAAQLNAYDKGEMDALVAQYRALVQAHVDNRNNPHETTAEDVDAVSKSRGGTYTADVSFTQPIIMNADNTARVCQSNGLYLEVGPKSNTVAVVGLNAEGIAVAGPKNAKSPIVTEPMFQDLKTRYSPDYATPPPVFQANFSSDVNIQTGTGELVLSRFTGFSGGLALTPFEVSSSEGTPKVQVPLTIAFDIAVGVKGSTTSYAAFGVTNFIVYARDNGIFGAEFREPYDSVSASSLADNKTQRVVATVDASGLISLYLDGVLKASKKSKYNSIADPALLFQCNGTAALKGMGLFRIWNQCLTPEQVSTL